MSFHFGGAHDEGKMIRLNGYYLYEVGSQIHPLSEIEAHTPFAVAHLPLLIAEGALAPFLQSVYRPKTSYSTGSELLDVIRQIKAKIEASVGADEFISPLDAYYIKSATNKFEAVVAAELGISPLYLVNQKGAYDTDALVSHGQNLFPSELENKVPEAIPDIRQATKCLAFELPTACGFHLHRANESVLHRYYDAVTNGAPRPSNRNMGDYLRELETRNVGDKATRSALKDLKDLHRNPLIHPENSLESVEEAIALLGSIQAIVTRMLKGIPIQPPPAPQAVPVGSTPVPNPKQTKKKTQSR